MTRRLRRHPVAAALAALGFAAATSLTVSCGLSTAGSPNTDCAECSTDADCTGASECAASACGPEGCCVADPLADGPTEIQTPGDCKQRLCAAGAVDEIEDAEDVDDDANPCTFDNCSADGEPTHFAVPEGTACAQGDAQGSCKSGKCVIPCSASQPCPDDRNACTNEVCDVSAGECGAVELHGVPVPGGVDDAGDCQRPLCVNGMEGSVNDDADTKSTPTDCDEELCIGGVALNPPISPGATCATNGGTMCDGSSVCVQCLSPGDCSGLPQDDDCQQRDCTLEGECQMVYTPLGVAVSLQDAGDCLEKVCNGVGGVVAMPDSTDPFDDNKECTIDTCDGISTVHTPKPLDSSCGIGLVCNGADACVGCTSVGQCPGMADFCKQPACNAGTCGFTFTPDDTPYPPGLQVPGDCKERRCNGSGNEKQVALDSDLPVDASECTNDLCNGGTPSNPPKPLNTPCAQNGGQVCTTSGQCAQCNDPALHCPPPVEICKEATCAQNQCGIANKPMGTITQQQVTGDCKLQVCDGMGTPQQIASSSDIPDDGNPCTSDYCTGSVPHNDVLPPGTTCGNGLECDTSGFCGKSLGQPCGMGLECASGSCADGVCCSGACTAQCFGCTLALTGMPTGTCAPIQAGAEDASPPCGGPNACDGAGSCKLDTGNACTLASQCASGSCADGYCCNTACTGTCKGCSAALTGGANGACLDIPKFGEDDSPACNGAMSCDGFGACKSDTGQPCGVPGDCASTYCFDGFCCNADCSATCKACSAALTGGGDGACANVPTHVDDPPSCGGSMTCNGTGLCKLDDGQPCAVSADCASNNCLLLVCAP